MLQDDRQRFYICLTLPLFQLVCLSIASYLLPPPEVLLIHTPTALYINHRFVHKTLKSILALPLSNASLLSSYSAYQKTNTSHGKKTQNSLINSLARLTQRPPCFVGAQQRPGSTLFFIICTIMLSAHKLKIYTLHIDVLKFSSHLERKKISNNNFIYCRERSRQ